MMRFDCSVSTQEAVRKLLGLDPRMIRFGITKLGDRQATLASTAGEKDAMWTRYPHMGRFKNVLEHTTNLRLREN